MPKVEFEVSRVVNEFCHLSVLYADLMPPELASGILGNRTYQEQHHRVRNDETRLRLQKTGRFSSDSEWYTFATGLMRRDQTGGFQSLSSNSSFVEVFQDLRQRRAAGFDEIWKETRPRLEEYKYEFLSQWASTSDRVLLTLKDLAKAHWQTGRIQVHYVDCLYGGFAWNDCIGLAALPDMEVQKKLLAHELSELITPQHAIMEALRGAGLKLGIAHTVVDMLAYFSVRDFLAKPDPSNREKKGIRPNPKYYPEADVLFPFFERYANDHSIYPSFSTLVQDMISYLRPEPTTPIINS